MLNANKKLFYYFDFKNFEDFKNRHDCICNLFLEEKGYLYPSKYPNWLDDAAADKTESDRKVKMVTKDGVTRTFNLKVQSIDNHYIINLYDITNLENAILKANASEQAKSSFLANMSHEIRTPLNGILGFTDVLTKKELDKDSKRYVEIIHKSGQTLLSVVNDILDYSKIESGELTLYETEANLFKEMEATVSTFASLTKKKNLNYYIFIDTTIPQLLKCDIQRVKQVVNNLISNAVKFTPQDGDVNVKVTLESLYKNTAKIHFSVKDSGIGVAKEKLATIFSAFSQADDSISREFGGTGLGLSISSQYIEMMGSKLKVSSQENKGSEFYFTLELDVINKRHSITQSIEKGAIGIAILKGDDNDSSSINAILYKYLQAWSCSYRVIESLEMIDDATDILIVSAQLFDYKSCKEKLDNFKNLNLIYIEGSQEKFECSHKQFHLLEQPMTGSALFDKLITLTNSKHKIISNEITEEESFTQRYNGHILVAEDNETNQMLISVMLDERGLDFTIVSNGQEAIDKALKTTNDYDVIFMDINMPILDGVSATKRLRKNGYTKPIVSLSANVIESDIISFKEAGVDDSIHKPIVPSELDRVLKRYTEVLVEVQEVEESYDSVDVASISKHLSILDEAIIHKLLTSFVSSAQNILDKLQKEDIDKDITHSIRGISGNFKFDILYKLATEFENNLDGWSIEEHKTNKERVQKHLKELISKIESL
jgi:signal transduction histidine kinase/FixJ family two-component response regulator